MTKDWIVRPIQLAGDQELVFEEGVVVTAKRNEYKGRGDCLFIGSNIENLTIRGYGATWKMQKIDYISGMHLKAIGLINWWFGIFHKAFNICNVLTLSGGVL